MAGYFARSSPAARCIPADHAELASGARRQRRCRVGTIDRMDDPGRVFQRTATSVPQTPASRPRTLERITMSHVQSVTGAGRAPASGRDGGRQLGVALLVIATAQLMVVLDSTIVNVALPHVGRALGFSGAGLEWVVNAYALTFGGLLLLGGRAGDLLGRRRSSSPACCCSPPPRSPAGSLLPRPGCWRPGSCRAPAGRSSRRP